MDPHSLIDDDLVKLCLKSDKGDSAVLQFFQVKDFLKKGENYASIITSVLVDFRLAGQDLIQSYIVKIKHLGDSSRLTDAMKNEAEREGNFFQEVVPLLNQELQNVGLPVLNIPKIPLIFREAGQEIIFLEDLRQRGFKMVDQRKGLDELHCLLAIEELARLHAASILLQKKMNIVEKHPSIDNDFYGKYNEEFKPYYAIFEGLIGTVSVIAEQMGGYDNVAKYLKNLQPCVMDFIRKHLYTVGKFAVIVHGDCWCNNAVFRYNENGCPEEVMFLDFDLTRVSSPAADLNYLFFSSLSGELRREKVGKFLQSYYDAFRRVLSAAETETPFTLEEFVREFENLRPYGFVMGLIMVGAVLMEKGDCFQFDKISEDNIEEILKENHETLLELSTSPVVSARFVEIFDDMTASGVMSKAEF